MNSLTPFIHHALPNRPGPSSAPEANCSRCSPPLGKQPDPTQPPGDPSAPGTQLPPPEVPGNPPHPEPGSAPQAGVPMTDGTPAACRQKNAAAFLAGCSGNVLLATGAKELAAFAALSPERLFPRVLPTREGIAACEAAGIPHKNIIAMQGPFSYALNCALIKQFSIRYLVTKDGGAVGGFAEKAQAAQDTGAQLIVVRRPAENGQTAAQILARCKEVLA